MSMPQILLADNSDSFSQTCAEYLEMYGYRVRRVFTPEECSEALRKGLVHLAILDLQMRDDKDEMDVSGLALAKQCNPLVPKIILTMFPTWQTVRESHNTVGSESAPAVSYVDKAEGLEVLLKHVRSAFDQHVRINWDLEIDWKTNDRFFLATAVEPELESESVSDRAGEMEDLFRRLFRSYDRVRIGELLWRRKDRLALKVFAIAKGKMPESLLVVCGRSDRVKNEARRYGDHAPKSPLSGAAALHSTAETTHFAANAYAAGGFDLENVRTLKDLYRSETRAFNEAVKTLYDQALAEWSAGKKEIEESRALDVLYCAGLGLNPAQIDRAALNAKIQSLIRRIPILGLRAELRDGELKLRFNESSFSYPDPTPFIFKASSVGQPVVLANTPGALSGDNVLIDRDGRVLLTDFAGAGPAPSLWNYVTLEAEVRFDWTESSNLRQSHDLEQCLVEGNFTRFDLHGFDASLQKPMRAVQQIRLAAFNEAAPDLLTYHLGLFYHAARRLVAAPFEQHLTNAELARMARLLMSAAMIAGLLSQSLSPGVKSPAGGETGVRLDMENFNVWVDGAKVRLTRQEFNLLAYLYARANQLCAPREIMEQALEYKNYDEGQETSVVQMAISRLRKKIEPNPHSRCYIQNDRGLGYRLILDPPKSPKQ